MKRLCQTLRGPAVCLTMAALSASAAMAGTIYDLTGLGALSGGQSRGTAINNSGQTVGASTLSGGLDRAFVNIHGGINNLGAPFAGGESRADGINGAGQVAGTTYTNTGARATLWTSGVAADLGALGGSDAWALSVNDQGSAVGGASTPVGQLHAFLYSGGSMTDLGVLQGGSWSSAYSINQDGQVAGTSEVSGSRFHAFIWDSANGMRDLGTLGGNSSYGAAINAAGSVVGSSQVAGGFFHAFFASLQGTMVDLGTLGGNSSYAYGINDSGWVVGSSWVAGSDESHAYLYRNGVMVDLNSIVRNATGWELTDASGINAAGQIVGTGLFNGVTRAFRLDAVETSLLMSADGGVPTIYNPEPSSWLLLATGIGALLGLKLRRNPTVPGPSRR